MSDSILVVDDDPGSIQLMGRILGDLGTLRFASNGADAVRLVRESTPDLILLDAEMPGMSGFKVFDELKAVRELADVPVIFVTNHSESEFEVTALEMGAADFIAKPVNPALVLARVKTHLRAKNLSDQLRHNAATDSLTEIANRGQFDGWLKREWHRSRSHGHPMCLLLIDVDHFKLFNDRYGHQRGDICLKKVARAIENTSRRNVDLVARCAGEEFGMLLPYTPRRGADYMAHRLLEAVAGLGIPHLASPSAQHLTISIGIACYDEASACWVSPESNLALRPKREAPTETDLLLAADKALYAAKRAGRAQVMMIDVADAMSGLVIGDTSVNLRRLESGAA